MGIRPYLGRLYEPREYSYFKNDTMVVSYRFWKTRLGGDPHVIGREIRLQDESVTIIGVLPPMSDLFPDTDVWPKLRRGRVGLSCSGAPISSCVLSANCVLELLRRWRKRILLRYCVARRTSHAMCASN